MAFKEINNQKDWDQLVSKQGSCFMQTWDWGEFRKRMKIPVFRLNSNNSAFQIEKRKLPFGFSYLYLSGSNFLKKDLGEIKSLAKKEKAVFFKIEPLNSSFKPFDGLKPSTPIQPKNTLVLDISPKEEGLFSSLHKKHRYNIRLAKKKNIKIKELKEKKEFDAFYALVKKTDQRKKIKSFSENYYKELFNLSQKDKNLKIVFLGSFLKKKLVACLILVVWKDRATYLVGASDYAFRKYMAPHLLQWHAIKLAKKLGAKKYDFWGVIRRSDFSSEKEFEHHPWAGITRFKEGFGGKEISFVGAYNYVFLPFWYFIYSLIKRLK